MESMLRAPLFVLPLLAPLALAQNPISAPADAVHEAEPVQVVLGGLGGGTLTMPGLFNGHLRALLNDEATESALLLEAELVPYAYLLGHGPAGSIEGLVMTYVETESEVGPVALARVSGEWSVGADGVGSIYARFQALDSRAVVGGMRGTFRVPPPEPIVEPLLAPPALRPSARIALRSEPPAVVQIVPAGGTPLETEFELAGPAIIVDYIPPQYVTRANLSWVLAL
jgi:hypothetical protein